MYSISSKLSSTRSPGILCETTSIRSIPTLLYPYAPITKLKFLLKWQHSHSRGKMGMFTMSIIYTSRTAALTRETCLLMSTQHPMHIFFNRAERLPAYRKKTHKPRKAGTALVRVSTPSLHCASMVNANSSERGTADILTREDVSCFAL